MKKPLLLVLVIMLVAGFGVMNSSPVSAVALGTDVHYYLHGPTLTLDTTAPTGATAKYVDSPPIKRDAYKVIGTWQDPVSAPTALKLKLSPLNVWLGLKNSDDQGTWFDLKVEVLKNGVPVAEGVKTNIQGITRNPDKALKVTVNFSPIAVAFSQGDTLGLRISAKVTNVGGHSSAVHLRLYYDAANRASNFDATTQYLVTYVAVGNALAVTVPADEWVNYGGTATGVFPALVVSGGTQCVFLSDNRPATITGPTTITGTYQTQYLVTYVAVGNALPVTVPADEWVNSGGATTGTFPAGGNDGLGTRDVFGSDNRPATITEPTTVTGTYQTQYWVTYAAVGNALPVTVPADEWVNSGGATTGTFPAGDTSGGTRDVFVSAAPALPTTITAPTTITGTYQTQYQLSLGVNPALPGGVGNINGGTNGTFYNAGTVLTLTATTPVPVDSSSEYRFANWSGGATGTLSVTMDAPKSIIANYNLVLLGQELTAFSPAKIWLGVTNSDNNGRKIDLKVEVYKNGTLVGSGEVFNVAVAGNDAVSGNNSTEFNIALSLVGSGVSFLPSDQLQSTVFVRRVGGSGDIGVRMWYNNSVGTGTHKGWSRFDATIGGTSNYYYYRSGSALATTADTTAQSSTLTATTTYQSFGTWSITLP